MGRQTERDTEQDSQATDLQTLAKRLMNRVETKERAEVEMQIRQRQCQIVPMKRVATHPFRSELGVERTPIFVCSSFKADWREYRRIITRPDSNERVEQIVRVGRKHDGDRPRGVLTQVHQEVFYKLLSLWDRAGYPLAVVRSGNDDVAMGTFVVSGLTLVRSIYGKHSGYRYKRLRSLLADMAAIPIVREHRYLHSGVVDVDEFTLLYGADWTGRQVDAKTGVPLGGGRSEIRIVFSAAVTRGFLHKEHKPLLLGPYLSLGAQARGRRAELARLLYPLLDHELSRKDRFHIKLVPLAERLGCKAYRYPSQRHAQFAGAVRSLDGLPILSEKFLLRVELAKSEDGTDWILRARRDGQESLPLHL